MILTPFEKEMLQTIQRFYPNSWYEVSIVYEIVGSFDNTSKVLAMANEAAESAPITANKFINENNPPI